MTLRAVVVTHYFAPHIGGVETVAAEHAARLRRRGWCIELFTTRLPDVSDAASTDGPCRRYRASNVLQDLLGVPVPLPSPAMLPALVRASERADVVIAHGHVYPTSVLAAIAARRARRPLVVVQHNPFVDFGGALNAVERAADAAIGRRVLHAAHCVVCVSKFTQRYVRGIAPSVATVVVPNGVDTDRFQGDGAACDGAPRLVTLRRLVPRNGVHVLLEAWDLARVGGRAELVIGGSGPDEAELRRRADDLTGVRLSGRVSSDDHSRFFQGAWAAVMPSITGEGFGLMAVEALACGVPVVASAQGAIPEIVRDGENGLLVRPGDPWSLARALRALVDDPALRNRLATACRASTVGWDESIDRLDAVLRQVIGAG